MSGWNDGISKQLSDYFDNLATFGDLAVEAIKEQVDIEVKKVLDELERTTPQGQTHGLIMSLKNAKIETRHEWYGYSVTFEGEDKQGTSYEKIANILNYGSSTIKPLRFIDKAIRNLKGLDDRTMVRFESKINSKSDL